jgi:hypothetical protein
MEVTKDWKFIQSQTRITSCSNLFSFWRLLFSIIYFFKISLLQIIFFKIFVPKSHFFQNHVEGWVVREGLYKNTKVISIFKGHLIFSKSFLCQLFSVEKPFYSKSCGVEEGWCWNLKTLRNYTSQVYLEVSKIWLAYIGVDSCAQKSIYGFSPG